MEIVTSYGKDSGFEVVKNEELVQVFGVKFIGNSGIETGIDSNGDPFLRKHWYK